jgi:tRNA(Glu) U13 pseudouridine synthase TruD
MAEGKPGLVEAAALVTTELADVEWRVRKIPNLTTSGTRRPLSVSFRDFSVEEAPVLAEESSSKRWDAGPYEGERWNPEGADLRLKFTLPPGTYATVLMREFMRSPLDHY